jgi:hypothetical protein
MLAEGTGHDQQNIADRAAQRAVEGMLVHFGFDVQNPIKVQQELAALRTLAKKLDDEDFVEDLAFIRRLRLTTDKAKSASISTIVNVLVTAFLGLLLLGTKDWWLKHITG